MRRPSATDRASATARQAAGERGFGAGERGFGAARDARVALLTLFAVLALALLGTIALARPSGSLAADPTQPPGGQAGDPPSCADRYPAEGPAGVDLRLGCIVSEVVGLYTAGQASAPPPLSTYAIAVGGLVLAGAVGLWLAGRLLARRAGSRLAPVLASSWWICATCRSVNGAGILRCYSCKSARPDGPMLTTDDHPEIAQSFGSRRKRG